MEDVHLWWEKLKLWSDTSLLKNMDNIFLYVYSD